MRNRNTAAIYNKLLKPYLKKYKDMKDYTLAKLVYEENKQHFDSLEQTRSAIRVRRNHNGVNSAKNKEFHKPKTYDTTNSIISVVNRAPKLKKFTLPKATKEILFLTDVHIPYQDDIALNTAIKYGLDNKVDCIWLNGDIMDMYGASSHEKLPDKALIHEEFEAMHDFLSQLRTLFPKAQIYYKEGNHERRWIRLLQRKAQELLGMKEFELNIILRLEELKIHWIPNETQVKFGDLNVIHGNEFKGGGGVNPARALYLRAKTDIIAGDKHKTQSVFENNLDNEAVKVYCVGCLCDLNPEYIPFAHTIWNLGFAHITMKDDKAEVKNYRIQNGKLLL